MKVTAFLTLILALVSCSQNGKQHKIDKIEMKEIPSPNKGSVSSNNSKSTAKKNTASEWKWEDCVRSVPEAVCKKNAFKNHSFRLDSTSNSTYVGYEKATLKNGDVMEIENCGCEYYTLDISFTTTHYKADTTDLVYWSDAAVSLLKMVEPNISSGISFEESYAVLQKYYLESESPATDVELNYIESEIGSYVSLLGIEKLSKNKYKIKLHYSVGPL